MKKNEEDKNQKDKVPTLPKEYSAPKVESESLLAFAASCNGSTNGGRKANVGGPNFCRSNRLNS